MTVTGEEDTREPLSPWSLDTLAAGGARDRTMAALFGAEETPRTIGGYRIRDVLGRGGMGVVYLAHDDRLDRPVALKRILPTRRADPSARAGLVKEAQRLARVQHPNVVSVFEVGTDGADTYLVMEYVPGPTLREWVAATPRSSRAIRTIYAQAGRGLAAAHEAGVLHLDFKPSNVLVASGDRPQVADFGLAQIIADARAVPVEDDDSANELLTTDPGDGPPAKLTTVGGTPAYMPPEQFEGLATAASDQFAFGISLLEALTGEHPFDRTNSFTLTESEIDTRLGALDRHKLPAWLLGVLRRAVALDPGARWPDMGALVDALDNDPAERRRRRFVLGLGAGGVLVGAVGLTWRAPAPAPCEVGAALEGTWDDARRAELARAMQDASAVSSGAEYLQRAFDDYATAWTEARREACVATRVERTQSNEALDLRYACLTRRRIGLAAAVDRALAAPARAATNPDAITDVLARVDPCADVERLRRGAPPIPSEHTDAVNEIRRVLAEAKLRIGEDALDEATGLLAPLPERAAAIDYPPIRAEIDTMVGVLEAKQLRFDEGRDHLIDAFFLAQEHGDEAQAAATALHLLFVTGYDDPRAEAELWTRQVEASGRRAGIEDSLPYLNTMAAVALRRGELERALALFERASETSIPGRPLARVKILNNRAVVLRQLGRTDEALAVLERSRTVHHELLGATHPLTALADVKLANVLRVAGRLDEAEPLAASAAATLRDEETQGGLEACSAAGTIWLGLGELERACPQLQRCSALADRVLGERHRIAAVHRVNLAGCLKAQEDLPGAEAALRGAVAAFAEGDSPELATARTGLADVLAARARSMPAPEATSLRKEALAMLDEAVVALEAQRGANAPALASPLVIRGMLLLEAGRAADAVAPLERAHALRSEAKISGAPLASARLLLAIARHEAGLDPGREHAEAHAAAQLLRGPRPLAPVAERWLRDNPKSP